MSALELNHRAAALLPVQVSDVKDDKGNKHTLPFVLLGQLRSNDKLTVFSREFQPAFSDDPMKVACAAVHEQSIGAIFRDADDGQQQLASMREELIQYQVEHAGTDYTVFVVPTEGSEALLGLFNDRFKEYEKKGIVDYMKHVDASAYSVFKKLVWFPVQAVAKQDDVIDPLTKEIVAELDGQARKHVNAFQDAAPKNGAPGPSAGPASSPSASDSAASTASTAAADAPSASA